MLPPSSELPEIWHRLKNSEDFSTSVVPNHDSRLPKLKDQFSHPYKIKGKITVLYTSVLRFSNSRPDDTRS